jgi:hypothetical protein
VVGITGVEKERRRMKKCDICGNEHSESTKSCAPCQKIILKHRKRTASKLRRALRDAYDKEKSKGDERYFKCFYTGITSKFNPTTEAGLDPLKDALVLTIDHENPEDSNSRLVVSLHILNLMKNKLPEDKFKEIVIALGKCFNKEIEQEDFENKFKQLL